MIKSNIAKAFILGLCMSALASGTAFAESGQGSAPAVKGAVVSSELNELYAKQKDIDQALFVDHVDEIKEKGFMINYTGVVDNYVEIGITPYSDDNANFLYELLGKDMIKVVTSDQSVLYTTTADTGVAVAEPGVAVAEPAKEDVYTTLEAPDTAVTSTDAVDPTNDVKDGEVSIQIESIDGTAANGNSGVNETLAADTGVVENAQVISAAVDNNAEETEGVSAPMMILAIAGGAAVIGGAVLATKKKPANK